MKTTLFRAMTVGVFLGSLCIAPRAQTMQVRTEDQTTPFDILAVDSVVIERRVSGERVAVHETDGVSRFGLGRIDGIDFDEGASGENLTVTVEVGLSTRGIPLNNLDSITFVEDTIAVVDVDEDGLSDYEEIIRIGTDPRKADTDGDGWSDNDEIQQFSPTSDPYRFNPRVADLPMLEVVLKNSPSVSLSWETSAGQTQERGVVTGTQISQSMTMSESFTSSYAQEHGWSVGVEGGWEGSGPKFSVSAGASGSYTTENITAWGSENTRENVHSYEEAELFAREENITYTGGTFMVPLTIRNPGNIAYTVENLSLAAYKIDLADTGSVLIIGALSQEGGIAFSPFTLDPGAESGVFNYVNTAQNLADLKDLSCSAEAVVCGVSGYHITMTTAEGNTLDFTSSSTTVGARTAEIIIDFGPGTFKPARKYKVATLTRYNDDYTSPDDMYFPTDMKDITGALYLEYELGEYRGNTGLVSVEGIAQDSAENAFWFVIHTAGGGSDVAVCGIQDSSYSFDDIEVKTGDIVELIYSKDQDRDGLPVRLERMMGISDTSVDSDGDGLGDFQEVAGVTRGKKTYKTNPALEDTDFDGIDDKTDPNPLRRPMASSTALVELTVASSVDSTRRWSTEEIDDTVTTSAFNVHSVDITVETAEPVYLMRINGLYTLKRNARNPRLYEGTVLLAVGTNDLALEVISEDETETTTFHILVPSSLDNFNRATVSSVSEGMYKTYNSLRINYNWSEVKDERPDGLVILAAEKDMFGSHSIAPRSTNYTTGQQLDSGIVVAMVESRSSEGSFFTHSSIKFNTTYYYGLYAWHKEDETFYYSEATAAAGKTTGKARFTVTLMDITLRGLGGDPGDCIEVYNKIGIVLPDGATTVYLFDVSDGGAKDVCETHGATIGEDYSFVIEPGRSFGITWYLSEEDNTSGDDHLGHGTTFQSYDDVLSPYHTTYVSTTPKDFTQYSSGDGGAVDCNFTFGWELIE